GGQPPCPLRTGGPNSICVPRPDTAVTTIPGRTARTAGWDVDWIYRTGGDSFLILSNPRVQHRKDGLKITIELLVMNFLTSSQNGPVRREGFEGGFFETSGARIPCPNSVYPEFCLGKSQWLAFSGGVRALKILFISPEVEPFVKVGGLADMVGALPKELA